MMRERERERANRNQKGYITTNLGPYSSVEQQIQIDAMLSRQFYEEEQTTFKQKMDQLIKRKSADCFD